MANVTLSSSDKTANTSISGGNLVATSLAAGNNGVRGTDRLTGPPASFVGVYWECTFNVATNPQTGVGICAGFADLTGGISAAGAIQRCMISQNAGAIYLNNSSVSINLGTIANGTTVCMALVPNTGLIWFRLGSTGNWNGNASYSPGGKGGIAAGYGPTTAAYPIISLGATNDKITANFGDSAFIGAVPTNFYAGYPAGQTTGTNIAVTDVALEEWASTPTPSFQVTEAAVEQWASVQKIETQIRVTQVAIEEWASPRTSTVLQADGAADVSFDGGTQVMVVGAFEADGAAIVDFHSALVAPHPKVLTADGCQDTYFIDDTGCCPPPLCGNDLCCTFVAFFNLLPTGPMWDMWKSAAIGYFQHGADPLLCPLLNDPDCPSLILHAIYCVLKLKGLIHGALYPALRESDPTTAITTMDYWLLQMQWEDCFNQHCRSVLLGEITPYEIWSDCGPMFCPPNFPDELVKALKHNTLRALARAQMGVIKNLCGINWIIEPLSTVVVPLQPIQPNPNPPPVRADQPCTGFCPTGVGFEIKPFSKYMEGVGTGDVCDSRLPQVIGYFDRGCDKPAGLPDIIWPGVLSAECIVRSLIHCPVNIVRTCPVIA